MNLEKNNMTTKNIQDVVAELTPQKLASLFHDTYEALAPAYGYETREETRNFDPESPNGKLMVAVCKFILETEINPTLTHLVKEVEAEKHQELQKARVELLEEMAQEFTTTTVRKHPLLILDDFYTQTAGIVERSIRESKERYPELDQTDSLDNNK